MNEDLKLKHLTEIFGKDIYLKLLKARDKYGYVDNWEHSSHESLLEDLNIHIEKGDPFDVAAYCMFLYFRNLPTSSDDKRDIELNSDEINAILGFGA
jgi:hypothetical protein